MEIEFAFYLAGGALSGILAGLFGVGGGLIITPILIFFLSAQGINVDLNTHIAVGTSLAIIFFTSMSVVISQSKRGAVNWSFFRWMTAGICLGTLVGAYTAAQLSGPILQKIIGVFAVIMAIQLLFKAYKTRKEQSLSTPNLKVAPLLLISAGTVIGWASAIFGIGGGSLTVPFLSSRGLTMQQSAGTSSACGLPIAIVGSFGYLLTGWNAPGLPQWSLGYIYLPALIGMALSSIILANIGVKIAHRLSNKLLRFMFAGFLICIGLTFLLGIGH